MHQPVVNEFLGIPVTPAMSISVLMLWPKLFPYRERGVVQQSARLVVHAEAGRDHGPAELLTAPRHSALDQIA